MPMVDLTIFEELKSNVGEDFIGELVEAYCAETPDLIARLELALAGGDADTFRRTAHSIKSSSASLGAMEFSTQAKELEMIGKSGNLSTAGTGMQDLLASYPALAQELRQLAGMEG